MIFDNIGRSAWNKAAGLNKSNRRTCSPPLFGSCEFAAECFKAFGLNARKHAAANERSDLRSSATSFGFRSLNSKVWSLFETNCSSGNSPRLNGSLYKHTVWSIRMLLVFLLFKINYEFKSLFGPLHRKSLVENLWRPFKTIPGLQMAKLIPLKEYYCPFLTKFSIYLGISLSFHLLSEPILPSSYAASSTGLFSCHLDMRSVVFWFAIHFH